MKGAREAARFTITDNCRALHGMSGGDDAAADEALRRLKSELMLCLGGWEAGQGTEFHLVLTVQPKASPARTTERSDRRGLEELFDNDCGPFDEDLGGPP